ncbi:MAG TPA: hypothetical protein DF603_17445 [Chryseobacterium sp.]|nr:hypothetical protein [Chryseobacterium sp.]
MFLWRVVNLKRHYLAISVVLFAGVFVGFFYVVNSDFVFNETAKFFKPVKIYDSCQSLKKESLDCQQKHNHLVSLFKFQTFIDFIPI